MLGAVLLATSIVDVLLDTFDRHSDQIAVEDPDVELSFAALNSASSGLSQGVAERFGGSPERIALAFGQNARYIVALTAVLRSGCVYVPLDPRRGLEWNRNLIISTGVRLVLSDSENEEFARELGVPSEVVEIEAKKEAPSDIGLPRSTEDIACIYATSGTTGEPKAVCDTYQNLLHNAGRYTKSLAIAASDRLSLIQAPIFSGTQSTIFMALTSGATLCCLDVSNGKLGDLAQWIADRRITVFHSVPSIFRTLDQDGFDFSSVRTIRLEGDQPSDRDVQVFRRRFTPKCKLVVGLGATECGLIRQNFIDMASDVPAGSLPVGRPVADMDVSVRDNAGRKLPSGRKGEVWVTSRYLAKGYLDDPLRTAAQFPTSTDGLRSYRTGDIGLIDKDGVLWLSGRVDQRVQIRGESIDLAEIERALSKLSFASQALVSANSDERDATMLTVHFVSSDGVPRSLEDAKSEMAKVLPEHVLPSRIVWLDRLPLTPDGKVDRKSLQTVHARPQMNTPYVAPRTETEQHITEIWQELLGISPIGVYDNLFSLGIDSLVIVRFADAAKRQLETKIKLSELYQDPTVAGIAQAVASELAKQAP